LKRPVQERDASLSPHIIGKRREIMAEQRPLTVATLAPVVFSLILGGIIGVEIHKYSISGNEHPAGSGGTPSASARGMGSGGGMGGGMGGGGGTQPNSGRTLARLVGNLSTIEKLQGKGLTPDQEKKLEPILVAISAATTLPEPDAKTKLDAVQAVLTPDQTQLIADMTPQRGGRGGGAGGGGAAGGGGPMGVPGGGGGAMAAPGGSGGKPMPSAGGGGMGGGGQQDPTKPFASERSKKSLDDLIAAVKKGAGS
jgi:hypothetical protein